MFCNKYIYMNTGLWGTEWVGAGEAYYSSGWDISQCKDCAQQMDSTPGLWSRDSIQ